jgi:quercetin dioxygenase-like cupin family protein
MKKETIKAGQVTIDFLLEAADSNGSAAMFEFTVPAGARVPMPHYHENFDETIYGLEGIMTFTVEGKPIDVAPGETCFIPRGAVHGFNNLRQEDARALAVITPALLGPIYFKEVAEIINAGGPPDLEKLKMVMAKHGMIPAIPKRKTHSEPGTKFFCSGGGQWVVAMCSFKNPGTKNQINSKRTSLQPFMLHWSRKRSNAQGSNLH